MPKNNNSESFEYTIEKSRISKPNNEGSNLVHMGQNMNNINNAARGYNQGNNTNNNNLATGIHNKNNLKGEDNSNKNLPGQNNSKLNNNQNSPGVSDNNNKKNELDKGNEKNNSTNNLNDKNQDKSNLPDENSNIDKLGQKKDDGNLNKNNPAMGIENSKDNKNTSNVKDKMPGVKGKENPKKKKDKDNSDKLNKKGKNKNNRVISTMRNTLNRRKNKNNNGNQSGPVNASSDGLENGKDSSGSFISNIAKDGIKTAFMLLPPQVKIAIYVSLPIVTVLILLFLLLALFLTTTVVTLNSNSCNQSEYAVNGEDTTAFLCSMTSPFGPNANGKEYQVSSTSGKRIAPRTSTGYGSSFHQGTDITGVSGLSSKDIYAVASGTIVSAGPSGGAYGNMVLINHNNQYYTRYAHLKSIESGISTGKTINQGDKIGVMGKTGRASGPHLHFELLDSNQKYLSANPFFGYSDKGYEDCLNPNSSIANEKCDFSNTKNARHIGQEGFTEVCGVKTNYTSSSSSSDCCNSYESSVNSDNISGLPTILNQEFVNGAIQTQSEYGVPASLTLAQIIQESGGSYPGNLSGLAFNCKNLFGIKGTGTAGSCIFNTGEQTSSGKKYTVSAGFRKYNNYSESIKDHGKLLAGEIYKKCTSKAKTAKDWAHAIKECGYATDVNYATNLINNMDKYNLYQYDDSSVFGAGSSECLSTSGGSGGSTDIAERALQEYEKWNKVSSIERTEMLKNYMQACGYGRGCNEWCAGFVTYILKETGKLNGLQGFSCLAASYSRVTAKPGSNVTVTHHKLSSGYKPQPGDVVIYGTRHVGLVEKVQGNTIHTIEGNTSGLKSATCWPRSIGKHTYQLGAQGMTEFVTIK